MKTQAGGATQARADLARLRKGDGESSVDPKLVEAAANVFKSADSGINAVRTYEPDHPAIERAMDAWFHKMSEFIKRHADLTVGLEGRALTFRGEPIYEVKRIEDNPWFGLYGAGIRQLTFNRRVKIEELVEVAHVLNMFRAQREEVPMEDDALTMMWQLDLKGVQYVAIDTFLEDGFDEMEDLKEEIEAMTKLGCLTELAGAALTGKAYANGEVIKRLTSITISSQDRAFLRSENLGALDEMPVHLESRDAELMNIDEDGREKLVMGVGADNDRVERYVDGLLLALEEQVREKIAEELLELLCVQFLEAIDQRAFGLALKIILRTEREESLIQDLVRGRTVGTCAKSFLETKVDETRENCRQILLRCESQADQLIEFLADVPDHQGELRAAVLDVAATFGDPTANAAKRWLETTTNGYAIALVDTMAKIDSKAAHDALATATKHQDHSVRMAGYKALFQCESIPARLHAAKRALVDDKSLVRQQALEFLRDRRPHEAKKWLRERIASDEFRKYELPEKKRFYRTLAAIGGKDVGTFLLEKFQQGNRWWNQGIDHERICAAWGLGTMREESAREPLEAILKKWFVRGSVKEAAEAGLDLLDNPREVRSTMQPTMLESKPPEMVQSASVESALPTQHDAKTGSQVIGAAGFSDTRQTLAPPTEQASGPDTVASTQPPASRQHRESRAPATRTHRESRAPDEVQSTYTTPTHDRPDTGQYIAINPKRTARKSLEPPGSSPATVEDRTASESNIGFGSGIHQPTSQTAPPTEAQAPSTTSRLAQQALAADAGKTTADARSRASRPSAAPRTARVSKAPRPERVSKAPRPERVSKAPRPERPSAEPPVKQKAGDDDLRKAMALAKNIGKSVKRPAADTASAPAEPEKPGGATQDAMRRARAIKRPKGGGKP